MAGIDLEKRGWTEEQIQDLVNSLLAGGANVTLTYNDAADTLTIAASDTQTDVSDDGTIVVSNVGDINFRDYISVVDDGDGTVTVNGSQRTDEEIQDIVDGLLVAGNAITLTYNDAADTLTIAVDESGISLANLGSRAHSDLSDAPSSAHHTKPTSLNDFPLDNSPSSDNSGSGVITNDTVGEAVSPGDVLFLESDGKYWKADADATGTMPVKVMAMESISADSTGKLLHMGYFRHDAWGWTLGSGEANLLYASTTAGSMTQTQPSGSGDQVQVLGYVLTADIVFFNPSLELVEVS